MPAPYPHRFLRFGGPPRGPRETEETDDGGGKAGNRDEEEEDCSGRRRDPSTPTPETTVVAPKCQHKTGEMGSGREDVRPRAGMCKKTEGEVRSGNKETVVNRPDRKATRKRAELAEIVRPSTITEYSRPNWNPIGRDRSG